LGQAIDTGVPEVNLIIIFAYAVALIAGIGYAIYEDRRKA
jgi:hypothetical protein